MKVVTFEVVVLLPTIFFATSVIVCNGDVCEERLLPDGHQQRAFGCPKLDDDDGDVFCCIIGNSSYRYCCNNTALSVYGNQTEVSPSKSLASSIGKIIVLVYGLVVVLIIVVDAISHFFVKKKKKEHVQ